MRRTRKKVVSKFASCLAHKQAKVITDLIGNKDVWIDGDKSELMPDSFKAAQRLNKVMILDPANVCGIHIKNEYTYNWFTRYVANLKDDYNNSPAPKLDYTPSKKEANTRVGLIYLQKIIAVIDMFMDSVRIKAKHDYPMTFMVKDDNFEFDIILAPRVEGE